MDSMKTLLIVLFFSLQVFALPPAIFYSPHQDDEAIGMAGGILEHKAAGRMVFLVLISNGAQSGYTSFLNSTSSAHPNYRCAWHGNAFHNTGTTEDQISWARKIEFINSGRQLGVDSIFIANNGAGVNEYQTWNPDTYQISVAEIRNLILDFEAKYPGASHKVTGWRDGNATHTALYDAAVEASNSIPGGGDFRVYRIYEYANPGPPPSAAIMTIPSAWRTKKRAALNEYKVWNTAQGRYAVGYHSMYYRPNGVLPANLIDLAYNSAYEYIDFLPQD